MPPILRPSAQPSASRPDTASSDVAIDPTRLTWLLELTGRFARERLDDHDSARLAAAIVIHLRALDAETPSGSATAATIEHWLELWEGVLERALERHCPAPGASLFELVRGARLSPA